MDIVKVRKGRELLETADKLHSNVKKLKCIAKHDNIQINGSSEFCIDDIYCSLTCEDVMVLIGQYEDMYNDIMYKIGEL